MLMEGQSRVATFAVESLIKTFGVIIHRLLYKLMHVLAQVTHTNTKKQTKKKTY